VVRHTFVFALTYCATLADAQSHPSWWTWVSPEATTIVGIRWENLRVSKTGSTVAEEIFGQYSIPELDCLKQSRQILLSSPPFVAVASANCKSAALRTQAPAQGLKRIFFKGIEVWIGSDPDGLGLARLTDQVTLIATRSTLQDSIERSQDGTGRTYSPLLIQAASQAQQNLWIVTTNPKDLLASAFAPLESAANQEHAPAAGDVSLQANQAMPVASPQLPPVPDSSKVALAPSTAASFTAPPPSPASKTQSAKPERSTAAATPPRQVIRILGLDEGTREIPMPPARR